MHYVKNVVMIWGIFVCAPLFSQHKESVGIYGGACIPITLDKGLDKDPRFNSKFEISGSPFGLNYEYDQSRHDFGIILALNYCRIGQKYFVLNSNGGEIGIRHIDMQYYSIPIIFKYRITDLAFFRLSVIAGIELANLSSGKETISNETALINYPVGVSIPEGLEYSKTYDGVFVPEIRNQVIVTKDKFKIFQMFGAVGLRGDVDLSENWTLVFDSRFNYGFFDSRTAAYVKELQSRNGANDVLGNPGAPDLYGQRNEVYITLTCGISRVIRTHHKFKAKQSPTRKSFKFEKEPTK